MKEYLNEEELKKLISDVMSFNQKKDESIEIPKLKRKKLYEDGVLVLEEQGNTVFTTVKQPDLRRLENHLIDYLCQKNEYTDADALIIESLLIHEI